MIDRKSSIILAALFAATQAMVAHAGECQAVVLQRGSDLSTFIADIYLIHLENPDNAMMPTMWEGPVKIQNLKTKSNCLVNPVDLIDYPIAAFQDNLLVLAAFSGSNVRVLTLDLARCTVRHRSLPMTGPITLDGGIIRAANRPVLDIPCGRVAPSSPR